MKLRFILWLLFRLKFWFWSNLFLWGKLERGEKLFNFIQSCLLSSTPSLASFSAISFPGIPLWLQTYSQTLCKSFRGFFIFSNSDRFLTGSFSQIVHSFVSNLGIHSEALFHRNLKPVFILSFVIPASWACWAATVAASISTELFDWSPWEGRETFREWFGLNQTSIPALGSPRPFSCTLRWRKRLHKCPVMGLTKGLDLEV